MKKILPLLVLLLTACGAINSPQPDPGFLAPASSATPISLPSPRISSSNTNPGLDPTPKTQRDITYCTMDSVALKMDLYYPPKSNQPAPGALFVHGGGWTQGDKSDGNLIPFNNLASQGFVVAAINYRLAPKYKFPAMIQDVKCAVRFLRANAAKLNLDPKRIGAWGGSAGGHLVALLGTSDANSGFDVGEYADQSSRVQAVVDLYGPADLTLLFPRASGIVIQRLFGNVTDQKESARMMSPVTYVTQDDPPFLILQGDKDNVVPPEQSQVLHERLKSVGVPTTLVIVKNAGHGFVPSGGAISPNRDELIKMIAEFFKKNLN